MTHKAPSAAQKRQQARMKKAVKEAQKHRKAHPSAKWSTCLQQGWKKV